MSNSVILSVGKGKHRRDYFESELVERVLRDYGYFEEESDYRRWYSMILGSGESPAQLSDEVLKKMDTESQSRMEKVEGLQEMVHLVTHILFMPLLETALEDVSAALNDVGAPEEARRAMAVRCFPLMALTLHDGLMQAVMSSLSVMQDVGIIEDAGREFEMTNTDNYMDEKEED